MCFSGQCPQEIYSGPNRGDCKGPINGKFICDYEQEEEDAENDEANPV